MEMCSKLGQLDNRPVHPYKQNSNSISLKIRLQCSIGLLLTCIVLKRLVVIVFLMSGSKELLQFIKLIVIQT